MISEYLNIISNGLKSYHQEKIDRLHSILLENINNHRNIFICGNGGSAANSLHIANDFTYMNSKLNKPKLIKVESLLSNSSVITCIANDISYDDIFSFQITSKGKEGDLLIVLSGSGNSKNIINAINVSKKKGLKTFGLIGFDGGQAKNILDDFIHFEVNDMQAVEDLQTIVFHYVIKKFIEL